MLAVTLNGTNINDGTTYTVLGANHGVTDREIQTNALMLADLETVATSYPRKLRTIVYRIKVAGTTQDNLKANLSALYALFPDGESATSSALAVTPAGASAARTFTLRDTKTVSVGDNSGDYEAGRELQLYAKVTVTWLADAYCYGPVTTLIGTNACLSPSPAGTTWPTTYWSQPAAFTAAASKFVCTNPAVVNAAVYPTAYNATGAIPVVVGNRYGCGVWSRMAAWTSGSCLLQFKWYTSGGAPVATVVVRAAVTAVDGADVYSQVDAVAPATSAYVMLQCLPAVGTHTFTCWGWEFGAHLILGPQIIPLPAQVGDADAPLTVTVEPLVATSYLGSMIAATHGSSSYPVTIVNAADFDTPGDWVAATDAAGRKTGANNIRKYAGASLGSANVAGLFALLGGRRHNYVRVRVDAGTTGTMYITAGGGSGVAKTGISLDLSAVGTSWVIYDMGESFCPSRGQICLYAQTQDGAHYVYVDYFFSVSLSDALSGLESILRASAVGTTTVGAVFAPMGSFVDTQGSTYNLSVCSGSAMFGGRAPGGTLFVAVDDSTHLANVPYRVSATYPPRYLGL